MKSTTVTASRPKPKPKGSGGLRTYGAIYPPVAPNLRQRPAKPAQKDLGPSAFDASPDAWVRILSSAIVDVVDGRREARTLQRWVSRELLTKLSDGSMSTTGNMHQKGWAKAHSVKLWPVSTEAIEAAATIWDGRRLRALAMRLERHRQRWVVTALEVG